MPRSSRGRQAREPLYPELGTKPARASEPPWLFLPITPRTLKEVERCPTTREPNPRREQLTALQPGSDGRGRRRLGHVRARGYRIAVTRIVRSRSRDAPTRHAKARPGPNTIARRYSNRGACITISPIRLWFFVTATAQNAVCHGGTLRTNIPNTVRGCLFFVTGGR